MSEQDVCCQGGRTRSGPHFGIFGFNVTDIVLQSIT